MDRAMPRVAEVKRDTAETQIVLRLNLDGSGQADIQTGVGFFDHMLEQIARHALLDLTLHAEGDLQVDAHHTVEDCGIALGQALALALGDKRGLCRYGHAYTPLDEALSRAVVDLSGRPGLQFNVVFDKEKIGTFDTELGEEFFRALVNHARITLHIDTLRGRNAHHIMESIFKAFARALRMAISLDERAADLMPSTKGVL